MPDDEKHRALMDRTNRLLEQSRMLRKMAHELKSESSEIRSSFADDPGLPDREGVDRRRPTKPRTTKRGS